MRRVVIYPLIVVAICYGFLVYLAWNSDSILFQPHPASYADKDFGSLGPAIQGDRALLVKDSQSPFQLVHFESINERSVPLVVHETYRARITALYLPNPQARYTLLLSHGNAEDIGDNLDLYVEYWRRGFAVFAYDYRGYGTSTGTPTESAAYADEFFAWHYLIEQLHVPPSRIIIHGTSVGCGPATRLAQMLSAKPLDERPAALILRSPFASAFTVLTRIPLLPWDKFPNASRIREVRMPVLVVHGTRDEVIPFAHGQKVFRNAPPYGGQDAPLTRDGGKQHLWIDGAGHNDIFVVAWKAYFDKVDSFVKAIPQ